MMKTAQVGSLLIVLMLAGCAREQDYLDVVREQQTAWNDVADVLETVKDEKSMAAAKKDLEARVEAFETVAKKAQRLPAPSPDFIEKHRFKVDLLNRAIERFHGEVRRIRRLPGGEAFCKQFTSGHPGLNSAVQP
jgi:hypothetical protein